MVIVKAAGIHGWSVSADVIEASAKAYLNAVNKLLSMHHKTKSAKAAFEAMKGLKL